MRRKLAKKISNLKLSQKMMVIYIVFAICLYAISVVALQVCFEIYEEKLYEKSLQELEFFINEVDRGVSEIEEFSYTIAMDTDIQEQLSILNTASYLSKEYATSKLKFYNLVLDELNLVPNIKNVLYTNKHNIQNTLGSYVGEIPNDAYEKILEDFSERRGGYTKYSPTQEYPYMLSGRDILEKKNASLKYLGTILITTDVPGIIKEKNKNLKSSYSNLYVYSKEGMIYSISDEFNEQLPDISENNGYKLVNVNGQKYFMCYLKSLDTDWMFVNFSLYSDIYGKAILVRNFMNAGFFLVFIISMILLIKISYIITKPLYNLSKSMQAVENGNFQVDLPVVERMDEVGLLEQEFKIMLEKINVLIHENYEKQFVLKDTKYKMLQAQINPHFLYNTLNTIHWMIKAGCSDDAGKMILELSGLLRAAFAKEAYVDIESEIRALRSYITIQEFRYKNRAEFIVETRGNLSEYYIPRMILQPLVENAIQYGVENSVKQCNIWVNVIEEEEKILIEVIDDGPGIAKDDLEKVRSFTIQPKGHGIGLKNINERLKISYEGSEFNIDSIAGVQTTIRIRIPKMRKENSNVQINDS